MQANTCLSVMTLYNYVMMDGYESQLHLVFCIKNLPELLLAETISILKAESIQKQYVLTDSIRHLSPDFAKQLVKHENLEIRERRITDCVENIIALDIAILKYIEQIPDIVAKHSFKVPQNADFSYLMGEYKTIKEKQIIAKISKALNLYDISKFNDMYEETPKLKHILFDNTKYTSRVPSVVDLYTNNGDPILTHDYALLVDFVDYFVKNQKVRSLEDIKSSTIPADLLNISLDVRQVLYALASVFSASDSTNLQLRLFFEDKVNTAVDCDESEISKKRMFIMNRSNRESTKYANTFMMLLVYFTLIEDNIYRKKVVDVMPRHIHELYNQFIIVLIRMIEHLLEYIQFRALTNSNKVLYSRLPIIVDGYADLKNMPITNLMFTLQYTLNFAPFLVYSEQCDS